MSNKSTLENRTILIAGATSGMGRATACAAASAGAGLVLLGRDRTRLDEIKQETAKRGASSVLGIQADAADEVALAKAFADQASQLAELDTLINSVSVNLVKRSFVELTSQAWASMINTNLNAAFNLAKLIVPVFRNRGGGLLINISSTAARRPDPSGAAYQATKAGVMAMTHAIMEEEWQNAIRATVILPGMTETPNATNR